MSKGGYLNSEPKYPQFDFKVDDNFPIKILDNMIQVEEDINNGFSLYNRGNHLKKSLIDPERVKEYLKKQEQDKQPPQIKDNHINFED